MANKSSPVFPMPNEPQHFSDYGFDPQMDYLQMLEEAKKHKREITSTATTTTTTRSTTDQALHFKLQKPISKEDSSSSSLRKKQKKKKSKWWRNALVFWRWKWNINNNNNNNNPYDENDFDIHPIRNHHHHHRAAAVTSAYRGGTISGPVYITESRSGSNTPCRATGSRPTSGPLTWNHLMTPNRKGETEIPYVSLKELNLDLHHHQQPDTRISASAAMPIYLVT